MTRRAGRRFQLVLVLVASAGITGTAALAQQFLGAGGAPTLPRIPPRGAWGEVIMANSKWIVVQNADRQQFPIRIDPAHVQQFLARWPTGPDALTNQSMVEAVGFDVGNNTIQTEYVDVFEGADQNLVQPMFRSVAPTNIDPGYQRFMSPWDMTGQAALYGWLYPVTVGMPVSGSATPARSHVVGPVVNALPLQVRVAGNNVVNVASSLAPADLKMFQVTRGTASFAQKGDLVYLNTTGVQPDSLVLEQLVLFKKIPLRQFNP